MPPTPDGFRWRIEDVYRTVTGAAFAKLVAENDLAIEGPFGEHYYAKKKAEDGWELYRTVADWDSITVATVSTADPAAGANIAPIIVPAGEEWRLECIQCTITADATVANRIPYLYIEYDGVLLTYETLGGKTVPASTTTAQSFLAESGVTTVGTQYAMHFPLKDWPAGARFRIYYSGLVAGDNITAAKYFYKARSVA